MAGLPKKETRYYSSIAIRVIVDPGKTSDFLLILPHAKNFS
jgi:hypothetical protein